MARRTTAPTLFLLDEVEKCEKDLLEGLMNVPEGGSATIVINSGGGSVYSGLGIGTVIRARRLVCTAHVLADCSSSALMVFSACRTRLVAAHASFLFHPVQWSSEDRSRVAGAKSWSAEFERIQGVCEEWLREMLPIDGKVLRKWMHDERYVLAPELIKLDIAQETTLAPPHVQLLHQPTRAKATPARSASSTARQARARRRAA